MAELKKQTEPEDGHSTGKQHHFFASISRMKYIERWALMRNSHPESLSEHSLEVAVLAHGLAVIGNVRYNRNYDIERVVAEALYHDAAEIITGDLPTPVKYGSCDMKEAYQEAEDRALRSLLLRLPEDLQPVFSEIFFPRTETERERKEAVRHHRLVKAADKLSAYIKCIEEENSGNQEFRSARAATERKLQELTEEIPELRDFCQEFLSSYGMTLDELSE